MQTEMGPYQGDDLIPEEANGRIPTFVGGTGFVGENSFSKTFEGGDNWVTKRRQKRKKVIGRLEEEELPAIGETDREHVLEEPGSKVLESRVRTLEKKLEARGSKYRKARAKLQ